MIACTRCRFAAFGKRHESRQRSHRGVRGEAPVHNPTGSDADMLIGMMGQDKRQAFLDRLEAMLLPAPAASR